MKKDKINGKTMNSNKRNLQSELEQTAANAVRWTKIAGILQLTAAGGYLLGAVIEDDSTKEAAYQIIAGGAQAIGGGLCLYASSLYRRTARD